jgi:hypothetical protein
VSLDSVYRHEERTEMAAEKRKKTAATKQSPSGAAKARASVGELLASTGHPLTREIQLLREMVLGVDESIREEVKWASVSSATIATSSRP